MLVCSWLEMIVNTTVNFSELRQLTFYRIKILRVLIHQISKNSTILSLVYFAEKIFPAHVKGLSLLQPQYWEFRISILLRMQVRPVCLLPDGARVYAHFKGPCSIHNHKNQKNGYQKALSLSDLQRQIYIYIYIYICKLEQVNLMLAGPCIIIQFKQINQPDATDLQVYYLTFCVAQHVSGASTPIIMSLQLHQQSLVLHWSVVVAALLVVVWPVNQRLLMQL